jgi:hypothetical protein
MWRRAIIFSVCLTLLLPVAAPAGAEDNMLGLYFDPDANLFCLDDVTPYQILSMHLILTNPTGAALLGFEVGCEMAGGGQVFGYAVIPGGSITMKPWDNLIHGLSEPYPVSAVTVLVTYDVLYLSGPLSFTLQGSNPSSLNPASPALVYEDGVFLGANQGPPARVNDGPCNVVISTEQKSLGAIKSLYR